MRWVIVFLLASLVFNALQGWLALRPQKRPQEPHVPQAAALPQS